MVVYVYMANTRDLVEVLQRVGLSDKAAKVYLSALTLGEATVLTLAKHSGVKRTSIYYTLEELRTLGALIETKRQKKVYYLPVEPKELIKRLRERVFEAEDYVEQLEKMKHSVYKKPRVYFLYGPTGFKKIWDMVFASRDKEFRIITEGKNFLDFVREKYILDDIIKNKKQLKISSRQLIVDSPYARDIIAKDKAENRTSKILPKYHKLPFTEVICSEFVAFISPRFDDTLFVVENERFAETRKAIFEITWESIKETLNK